MVFFQKMGAMSSEVPVLGQDFNTWFPLTMLLSISILFFFFFFKSLSLLLILFWKSLRSCRCSISMCPTSANLQALIAWLCREAKLVCIQGNPAHDPAVPSRVLVKFPPLRVVPGSKITMETV